MIARWSPRAALALLALISGIAAPRAAAEARELRVCADPNNMPFSNDRQEGFENKIVAVIAQELDATVSYVWWAQRRGYVRTTLKAQSCELWPGVATGVNTMTTTRPYYRSSYMFVSRTGDHLDIVSFDDPKLRDLTVGVQMIGSDATNTPPAHALARRGITRNVRGFMLYGDYTRPNPPAAIVGAVATKAVDIAIVWGPLAGYFAAQSAVPLTLAPVPEAPDGPIWPMSFDISMGVGKGDVALKDELDRALDREKRKIDAILDSYYVPRDSPPSPMAIRAAP